MKIGDIVWTEAYGHISKWVVVNPNSRGFVKLYHIQDGDEIVERDEIIGRPVDDLILTEAEAIQRSIEGEKTDFENRLYNHNAFIEKMAKKLGQLKESEVNHDNP